MSNMSTLPLVSFQDVKLFDDGCPMAAPEQVDENEEPSPNDPFWASRPHRRICVLCDGNCECEVEEYYHSQAPQAPLHICGECDQSYHCNLWDPKHGCCGDCENFPECAVCIHLSMVESFHNGGIMAPPNGPPAPIAVASDQKQRDKERKQAERAIAKEQKLMEKQLANERKQAERAAAMELRHALKLQKIALNEQKTVLKAAEKLHKQELKQAKAALKAIEKQAKADLKDAKAAQKAIEKQAKPPKKAPKPNPNPKPVHSDCPTCGELDIWCRCDPAYEASLLDMDDE